MQREMLEIASNDHRQKYSLQLNAETDRQTDGRTHGPLHGRTTDGPTDRQNDGYRKKCRVIAAAQGNRCSRTESDILSEKTTVCMQRERWDYKQQ